MKSLAKRLDGPPGPEGSIDKLLMARVEQQLLTAAMNVVGGTCLA